MPHFTIELSNKADSHWAVHQDGVPVAWFEGTNAAERWIAERERELRKARNERMLAAIKAVNR
jgi:hypothetical protein